MNPRPSTSGESVSYAYDSLNRLISANSTFAGQSQTFGYDGFGNLVSKPPLSVNVDPATNRITSLSYDGNGNVTFQPAMRGNYVYDVENRMTSAPGVQYGYDGQNKRNYKAAVNSNGVVTSDEFYFYGVDGKKIGTYYLQVIAVGGPANLTLTFSLVNPATEVNGPVPLVYFRGRVLAPQDRLGSIGKYYPYGEDKATSNPGTFATYTRDAATGLDYADQRYYSSQFGRFMSADPHMASGGPGDPGSWNRYSYTRGDPVNRFDPQGLADFSVTGYCSGCQGDPKSGGIEGQYGGDAMEMDRSGEGTDGGGFVATFTGSGKPRKATNVSRSGYQEDTIANRLHTIADQILRQNNDCSRWLTGSVGSGLDFVNAILGQSPSDYSFGHADLNGNSTAAFVGTRNSDGSAIFDANTLAPSITVNNAGAFFNSNYQVGPRSYVGGSVSAQIFILHHEIAHQVGAANFKGDAGYPDLGKANDRLIEQNCGKQIRAVR